MAADKGKTHVEDVEGGAPAATVDTDAAKDSGTSGTDDFNTYQDEAGKTAANAPKEEKNLSSDPGKDPSKPIQFDHGEESELTKQNRETQEALQKDPLRGVPAQQLPDNQDPTVAG